MRLFQPWFFAACLAAFSCGGPPRGPDGAVLTDASIRLSDGATVPSPGTASVSAADRYAVMCAVCHGVVGEGGSGPNLQNSRQTLQEMEAAIDQRMPEGNPAACRGECARSLAEFIKSQFTTQALACESVPPSPRRVRLLNRREYRNTVLDLFRLRSGATPGCNLRSFTYNPGSRTPRSVHLAGSFNGWSATAWPMTFNNSTRVWEIQREIPDGTYQYKFVLDGNDWQQDPANSESAPDGFGGRNSVTVVACGSSSGGTTFDPAAMLPVEARPQHFAFDTSAESGQVSAVHANEYQRAARALLTAVGSRLGTLVGCDYRANAASCAEQFVNTFGRRAFRRPLTSAETQRYRTLITSRSDFLAGVSVAIRAFLNSPNFLYRTELGQRQSDGTYQLDGFEIASGLSYFLWGTMPDDALLDAAQRGALNTPEGMETEARRLLADPRAREALGSFAEQWLGIEPVATTPRSAMLYPDFDDATRAALVEETRRFVTHVFFDGTHRFEELFTANYTFVNSRLARHYGLSSPSGDSWAQTRYADTHRSGVLGHGSVLTRYAHSDQSSPILRGVFVRQNLLCQIFPPPPANAGGVPDVNPNATTRERFRQHSSNPACASCHRFIDGMGFGFERFDAVGRFRTMENGRSVDAAGELRDLERFGAGTLSNYNDLSQLGSALANSPTARACMVRSIYRYARGFRETALDQCAIQAITQRFERSGGDLRELLVAVLTTRDFWRRK